MSKYAVDCSPDGASIDIGKTTQIGARVTCVESGDVEKNATVLYKSSEAHIATVNSAGVVRGISRGITKITASFEDAKCEVEVQVS